MKMLCSISSEVVSKFLNDGETRQKDAKKRSFVHGVYLCRKRTGVRCDVHGVHEHTARLFNDVSAKFRDYETTLNEFDSNPNQTT